MLGTGGHSPHSQLRPNSSAPSGPKYPGSDSHSESAQTPPLLSGRPAPALCAPTHPPWASAPPAHRAHPPRPAGHPALARAPRPRALPTQWAPNLGPGAPRCAHPPQPGGPRPSGPGAPPLRSGLHAPGRGALPSPAPGQRRSLVRTGRHRPGRPANRTWAKCDPLLTSHLSGGGNQRVSQGKPPAGDTHAPDVLWKEKLRKLWEQVLTLGPLTAVSP